MPKNLRKIPLLIQQKIETLGENPFTIACAKRILASDIAAGAYSHIGLTIINDMPHFSPDQIPSSAVGRFSRTNREGKTIIRKDLPKISKTYSHIAPNFGDWSKGSHDVDRVRQVYQREFFPPQNKHLTIELITEDPSEDRAFIFKFAVAESLNRENISISETNICNDLFFNLNLLQEAVGAANIFRSNTTHQEILESVNVSWEFLPPGNRDEVVDRILSDFRHHSEQIRETAIHRYNLLVSLNPVRFIHGVGEFRRYFGAQFSDNLVVFENLEPGNAIYIMRDDWALLSRLSRTHLLENPQLNYNRITHLPGWESRLISLIEQSRLTSAA